MEKTSLNLITNTKHEIKNMDSTFVKQQLKNK